MVWPEKKHRTVVSSYAKAVTVGGKTIIIGERINPTGKSKFKQALRDHNLESVSYTHLDVYKRQGLCWMRTDRR